MITRKLGKDSARKEFSEAGATRPDNFGRMHDVMPRDSTIDMVLQGKSGAQYTVLGKLGEGGMGSIYHAQGPEGIVAIKMTKAGMRQKSEMERFFTEARAVKSLNHPNVIRIFDLGTWKDKVFYVMESLKGRDLGDMLRENRRLYWNDETRCILRDVCNALHEAHARGIWHRDMKPENIFMAETPEGEIVKVLDFGLAKLMDDPVGNKTEDGTLLGTPNYMAPEIAAGKQYDYRVDIYSLGVIMYRLLTGRVPFKMDSSLPDAQRLFRLVEMIKTKQPPRPTLLNPSIPLAAEAIILKAMAKNPDDRYQTMKEMRNAIMGHDPSPKLQADAKLVREPNEPVIRVSEESAEHVAEEQKKGWFGKAVLVVAAVAAIGAGVRYKDEIGLHVTSAWVGLKKFAQELQDTKQEKTTEQVYQVPQTFQARINSNPPGASVYLGRKDMGKTPLSITLSNGEHDLVIKRRGYKEKQITVSPQNPNAKIQLQREWRRREPSEDMLDDEPYEGSMEVEEVDIDYNVGNTE